MFSLPPKTKQAIIDANCKQYVLIEQANTNDSRVYSSSFTGAEILKDVSYWSLSEFLKIIK